MRARPAGARSWSLHETNGAAGSGCRLMEEAGCSGRVCNDSFQETPKRAVRAGQAFGTAFHARVQHTEGGQLAVLGLLESQHAGLKPGSEQLSCWCRSVVTWPLLAHSHGLVPSHPAGHVCIQESLFGHAVAWREDSVSWSHASAMAGEGRPQRARSLAAPHTIPHASGANYLPLQRPGKKFSAPLLQGFISGTSSQACCRPCARL